jgi:hypothetical protein
MACFDGWPEQWGAPSPQACFRPVEVLPSRSLRLGLDNIMEESNEA